MKKTILTERFQQLAGLKSLYTLNEEYKGTDLLEALKDLQKRLTAESFNVAPLQKDNEFKKEITDKVGADGSKLAALLLQGDIAKIVVNEMASPQLDKILKEMGLEDSKFTPGEKIATSAQEPGSISVDHRQKYPKGCYQISLTQAK